MSILDNNILDETDYEFGFPEKTDIITEWGSSWKTKFYAWESPLLLSNIANKSESEHDKNVFGKRIKTILATWSLAKSESNWEKNEVKTYQVGLYIATNKKDDIPGGDYYDIAWSDKDNYSACRAKTLAYKTLLAIKKDPGIVLEFIHSKPRIRIEDMLKEKGILK